MRTTFTALAISAGLVAGISQADTTLVVPPGSSADVDVTLSISTFLGGASDDASGVVDIDESLMTVDPNPGSEPFTSMLITEHLIFTSGADLSFCFYPIFGTCGLTLQVDVDQLDVTLANDLNVAVDASGNWSASAANYDLVMRLSYDGGAIVGTGTADATAILNVGTPIASLAWFTLASLLWCNPRMGWACDLDLGTWTWDTDAWVQYLG